MNHRFFLQLGTISENRLEEPQGRSERHLQTAMSKLRRWSFVAPILVTIPALKDTAPEIAIKHFSSEGQENCKVDFSEPNVFYLRTTVAFSFFGRIRDVSDCQLVGSILSIGRSL